MLDVMGSGDLAENDNDEQVAADSIPDPTTTAKTPTAPQQPFVKKGRKVVDDWDAGEDALVEEENYLKNERAKTGANDDEEYDKLMNVYKAFRLLKTEFDSKFREIWA
jgi:ATP-dependent RNA helicase DDX60